MQSDCLAMRARVASASGANGAAIGFAEQTVASAQKEQSGDPVYDRYRVASAYRLLGDVRSRAGDRGGATEAWTAGLGQWPAGVSERPIEMNERMGLLQRLGRAGEARPLAAHLAAIGYHSVI